MFNPNKITKILGATFVLVSSNVALAADVDVDATVTVQNSFTLVLTGSLDFGTVRVTADPAGTNSSSITIDPLTLALTNSNTEANSAATPLDVTGTVPSFAVSDAASFTDLTLILPTNFALTASGAPPTSPALVVEDLVAQITSGGNSGDAYNSSVPNLQTDTNGEVAFTIGATLSTSSAVSTTDYLEAAYTGTFNVEVTY